MSPLSQSGHLSSAARRKMGTYPAGTHPALRTGRDNSALWLVGAGVLAVGAVVYYRHTHNSTQSTVPIAAEPTKATTRRH
ncbi:hypothetical protein CAOG_009806 [Capsaspora owczarzaki ATCC 30864]|uniref:Uncharacterized protein n=1 Tax=Capsaspora owczarzaki (strain ATCC 30864) TaxID=595528 RepID=A0A0D2UGS4_CAPO3|nr:hypothetical protein CAOG_009806 [Capsaspora owczarzaki ATCC 30864]